MSLKTLRGLPWLRALAFNGQQDWLVLALGLCIGSRERWRWPNDCGYIHQMVSGDTGTFIFLMACLLGGMLIAAYAFHLYLSVG